MKRSALLVALLLLFAVNLTGCDFVGDVIEFSLWMIFILIAAVVLIIYLLKKAFFD